MVDNVLVIDDSPDIHALVKVGLGKEQIATHSALDGAAGLAAALAIRPDVILLDVEMPERDGFAVCADLKDDPRTKDIAIIFVTGAASTADKIRGLELGAIDYVTKPFDSAELQARVRAALRTRDLVELLSKKAMIDGLTGLWNRSYLDAHLAIEISSARRSSEPLSCIMADIDGFKAINDQYGHGFGDVVLRALGGLFAESCRASDIVCRYGGEEFAILLPSTLLDRAAILAERLRQSIESGQFVYRGSAVRVTCSFGVADLRELIPPALFERADKALYRAKNSGRNRVEVCLESELIGV